jgi:acetyl esterase/lipase
MRTIRCLIATCLCCLVPSVILAQARIEKNVVVGMVSGLALVMDEHRPATPNGYGVVHISGSGWGRPLAYNAPLLSESQVAVYGKPLVDRGYTVFSLNHRATPRFRYPAPLEDVQRAVRFIRAHARDYGIDPDRLGATGGSSGGHLVLLLGMLDGRGDASDPDPVNRASAKVQTVVARAAPADLSRVQTANGRAALSLLMGAQNVEDAHTEEGRRYRDASPVSFVSADDPPTLLLHGDADETIPFEQAGLMQSALGAAGVPSNVIRVPEGRHGPTFPGARTPPDYIGAMVAWFDRHLKK